MMKLDNKLNPLSNMRFIDLFAGIGAFRYAMESFGAECVFSSEWDKACQKTYAANHGDEPAGDITKINEADVPKHDVICAGFPCQPFSINGNQEGFADKTRGQLFFEICRIAKFHHPKWLILENVRNLATLGNGHTFRIIRETLEKLGYSFSYLIMNSSLYGVPQSRERVFMFCNLGAKLGFPSPTAILGEGGTCLTDVLEPADKTDYLNIDINSFEHYIEKTIPQPELNPIRIGRINKGRQGERIYHPNGHSITLSSGGGGIGAKTGLYKVGDVIRRLSPRECARLTGLDDSFKLHPSNSQCYKQFGNSLVVDVAQNVIAAAVRQDLMNK